MSRFRNNLHSLIGLRSGKDAANTKRAAGSSTTPDTRNWWVQTRWAALGSALAALLLSFSALLINALAPQFEIAGIPAYLLFVSILLPLGLWALAMWHEGLQHRITLSNRMDQPE